MSVLKGKGPKRPSALALALKKLLDPAGGPPSVPGLGPVLGQGMDLAGAAMSDLDPTGVLGMAMPLGAMEGLSPGMGPAAKENAFAMALEDPATARAMRDSAGAKWAGPPPGPLSNMPVVPPAGQKLPMPPVGFPSPSEVERFHAWGAANPYKTPTPGVTPPPSMPTPEQMRGLPPRELPAAPLGEFDLGDLIPQDRAYEQALGAKGSVRPASPRLESQGPVSPLDPESLLAPGGNWVNAEPFISPEDLMSPDAQYTGGQFQSPGSPNPLQNSNLGPSQGGPSNLPIPSLPSTRGPSYVDPYASTYVGQQPGPTTMPFGAPLPTNPGTNAGTSPGALVPPGPVTVPGGPRNMTMPGRPGNMMPQVSPSPPTLPTPGGPAPQSPGGPSLGASATGLAGLGLAGGIRSASGAGPSAAPASAREPFGPPAPQSAGGPTPDIPQSLQELLGDVEKLKALQTKRGLWGPAATPQGVELEKLMQAFRAQESGGSSTIQNDRTNATGLYQVMPNNITGWTDEKGYHKGWPEEMGLPIPSVEQFKGSPELQTKVARFKLKQYLDQAKSASQDPDEQIRRVASAWYSGKPENMDSMQGVGPLGDEPSVHKYTMGILSKYKGRPQSDRVSSTIAYALNPLKRVESTKVSRSGVPERNISKDLPVSPYDAPMPPQIQEALDSVEQERQNTTNPYETQFRRK